MTAYEKLGHVALCRARMLQVSNPHPCRMFKNLSGKDSAVPWGENIKEQQQQTNQTNKISQLHEATVRSGGGAGVAVSTVLSDFHGSHNKTGLGDRGKTRVGKVLQTVGSSIGTAPGHFPALSPGSSGAPEAGRHREQPSTTAFSR